MCFFFRYSELGELGKNFESTDSNHELNGKGDSTTKVPKKSNIQKSLEVEKTPKDSKISKNIPKTEPTKRVTRGRPVVAKLNESFDETKTVKDNQVSFSAIAYGSRAIKDQSRLVASTLRFPATM